MSTFKITKNEKINQSKKNPENYLTKKKICTSLFFFISLNERPFKKSKYEKISK